MLTNETTQERQDALYAFLLQRGDKWTPMERATDTILLYPAFFTSNYHNSWARRLLTRDIAAINESDRYEKIIISGNRGIKLANESEFMRFLKAEYSEVFRKLKRARNIARKAGRDQQHRIEGRIYESFLGGEGDG